MLYVAAGVLAVLGVGRLAVMQRERLAERVRGAPGPEAEAAAL